MKGRTTMRGGAPNGAARQRRPRLGERGSFLLLAVLACHPCHAGVTAGAGAEVETRGVAEQTRTFDFVVSFASIGAGIDDRTRADVVALLESLGDDVHYIEVPWGLEGELDYCIDLADDANTRAAGIEDDLRRLLDRGKYVTLEKNSACPHLRTRD
jgi:hypothetical protein